MNDTTQPVVDDANTTAEPVAEANNARNQGDDLDSLLNQFQQETTRPASDPPSDTAAVTPDVNALMAKVQSLEGAVNTVSGLKFKQDMDATIKDVRGEMDPEVFDNSLVEAWIDSQARNDPRLQKAWLERDNNPQQFKRITQELGKSFAKKFSKLPDKNATEDREIVAAAVRGASTKAPAEAPPNYSRKTNAEFRNDVIEKYGFDPGV